MTTRSMAFVYVKRGLSYRSLAGLERVVGDLRKEQRAHNRRPGLRR
jgi:hypothetical protein